MENKIYIGAAYYPEQWPEERWETDAELMKEAGINVVRIAEFGWSLMEPADGVFDFSLFDRAIKILWEKGISIVLGTPTMVPPLWMWKRYPDIVIDNEKGLKNGRRSAYCSNNPDYIKHTKRFVEKMAEHYKNNPAVIAWQVDNEYNGNPCYCRHCSEAFRKWLEKRYGLLENLNREWGTVFWSQIYSSWDEVNVPASSEMITTVSQKLDFLRFTSDSKLDFHNIQAEILHKVCGNQLVTHNGMGLYDRIDYHKLGENLDFYSWDTYPAVDGDPLELCLAHDVSRGIMQKSYWVMEQKNGYFNHSANNLAIEPGIVRLWSYRGIARGADGIVYFRWRSGRFGIEQHPQGLLRHDGSKRRVFAEIAKFSEEMKTIGGEIAGSGFGSEVAMLWNYDQIWALETHIQNERFSYKALFKEYYNALIKLGINADVISPTSRLDEYKLVIAPALFVLNEEIAGNLIKYVEAGGILVLTVRNGVRTWSNVTVDTPWPGLLHKITGATVVEFDSLPAYLNNSVKYNNKVYKVDTFLEILECTTAKPLALYDGKFYKGQAAVTENEYGKGKTIYSGVMGNKDLIADMLNDILNNAGIRTNEWPEGIEVTYRKGKDRTFMFVLNSSFEDRKLTLPGEYTDVFTGKKASGEITVNKLDALVFV